VRLSVPERWSRVGGAGPRRPGDAGPCWTVAAPGRAGLILRPGARSSRAGSCRGGGAVPGARPWRAARRRRASASAFRGTRFPASGGRLPRRPARGRLCVRVLGNAFIAPHDDSCAAPRRAAEPPPRARPWRATRLRTDSASHGTRSRPHDRLPRRWAEPPPRARPSRATRHRNASASASHGTRSPPHDRLPRRPADGRSRAGSTAVAGTGPGPPRPMRPAEHLATSRGRPPSPVQPPTPCTNLMAGYRCTAPPW
jgi:hypothetical protein